MQYIHSKDIFMLMRDVLKLANKPLMDHGSKVAYYLYKMLQYKGGYEEFELADFAFMATFHDIGAYKTDYGQDLLRFEVRGYMPHSAYGYLFFKYLSSLEELAKIILYHHMDYVQLQKASFRYKEIAAYLNIAEKMVLYSETLGDQFGMHVFKKQLGIKISEEGFELFQKANAEYDLFGKVKSEEYQKELDSLANDYLIMSNELKEKFMEVIMYCTGLINEAAMADTFCSIYISEQIGIKLGLKKAQLRTLYFAGLLHDIGMMGVPYKVWAGDVPVGKDAERFKQHVLLSEHLLKNRMQQEITAIVAAHHERADGSGYPRKLTEKQMNVPQMILQFADAVVLMINPRPGTQPLTKADVIQQIRSQAGTYKKTVMQAFIDEYDEIVEYSQGKTKETLQDYRKLQKQYAGMMKNL